MILLGELDIKIDCMEKSNNNTCMFPIRCENRTRPMRHMMIANVVSPHQVVVIRFCPYELNDRENKREYDNFYYPLKTKFTNIVKTKFTNIAI